MLESMSKKNFFTSLTMKKVHIKSAPKKIKNMLLNKLKILNRLQHYRP